MDNFKANNYLCKNVAFMYEEIRLSKTNCSLCSFIITDCDWVSSCFGGFLIFGRAFFAGCITRGVHKL